MKTILTTSGPRRIATYRTATIAGLTVLIHPAVLPRTGEVCTDPRTGLSYGGGPDKVRRTVAHLGLESVRDYVAGHDDAPAPTDDIPVAEQWSGKAPAAKHDVHTVATAIVHAADAPGSWIPAIVSALSSRTGRLKAKAPADDLGKAAWNGLQPNPWKVQFGSCFLRGEAAEILAHLAKHAWPAWLDSDAKALQDLGVWR